MPSLHRRALLKRLGAISTGLVAGCNANPDQPTASPPPTTERSSTTPDPSVSHETTTDTATTESDTSTEPLSFGSGPGPLPDATWPLTYRGVTNSSYAPDGPRFERQPIEQWLYQATIEGEPDHFDPRVSAPVIADGRLYLTKILAYGPNQSRPDQHFLRCHDTATGRERWQQPIRPGSGFPTAPALRGDMVFVGQDRVVRAHETETGEVAWRLDVGEPIRAIFPTRDRIYLAAHRSVRALADDNEEQWSLTFEEYPGVLALGTRNLYLGASRRLHAVDPATGTVRWKRTLPATSAYGIDRLVTVDGGVFVLQNSGDLYTFDDSGQPVWRPDGSYGAISTDGERLYAGAAGTLRTFAVPTGKQLWELQCADLAGCESARFVGKPIVTDEVVYVPIDGGHLAAVRPDDGSVEWHLDEMELAVPFIALGEDGLYSVNDNGGSVAKLAPQGADGR